MKTHSFIIKILSKGILKIPQLDSFLGYPVSQPSTEPATHVAGWGLRPSAEKARAHAQQHGLTYWSLEDGFIHSLGQGVLGHPPCSMVVDPDGIYYDATKASRLEYILSHDPEKQLDTMLLQRARAAIQIIQKHRITKYNNAPLDSKLSLMGGENVLLVDQTYGDMSLQYGLAAENAFEAMLAAALLEHPHANIIIKTHPDVLVGKKKSCFPLSIVNSRVQILTIAINPYTLLQHVKHVYVATSQLGFEALMLGKPVTCFGVPFYAGWGLTDDRADPNLPVFARRQPRRTLEEVFAAAYILYTRYVHPDYHKRCELEAILDYFAEQNRRFRENSGKLYCFGFTLWKRNYIRHFLRSPGNQIHFVWTVKAAKAEGFANDCQIVVWGNRAISEAQSLSSAYNIPIWRMEDAFIRSVELGSDFTPPMSLVLDKRGIYYDPNQPSDLEYLLETHEFPDTLLQRAEHIRTMLLKNAVSKYNLGKALPPHILKAKTGQRIILVPGQVEDDASIRLGCRDINTNAGLLRAVREANPDAYIIYKPHPDVISGNRKGAISSATLKRCCDLVLEDITITDCLAIADEVHTMTSLVGFEALLRHLPVSCYGIPFYAGWGLTQDRHPQPRRTRRLTLPQLVAATLILYPRYINWQTGAFTSPEFAIQTLREQINQQGQKPMAKQPWLLRQARKLTHIYRGVFYKKI